MHDFPHENMKTGEFKAVSVDRYIYVMLSVGAMYRLDYTHEAVTWEKRTCYPSSHILTSSVVAIRGQLAFMESAPAGCHANMSIYNHSEDSWRQVNARTKATMYPAVVSTTDFIFCFGGVMKEENTDIVERMNIESFEWSVLPSMKNRVRCASAVEWKEKIYLVAGYSTNGARNLIDMFDPTTNGWTEIARIPNISYQVKSYAIGGEIFVVDGDVKSIFIYNIEQNQWKGTIKISGMSRPIRQSAHTDALER